MLKSNDSSKNRMIYFHSKEIKSKDLSRFTEWINKLINKSIVDLTILSFIYKLEVGTILMQNVDNLSIILIG